MKKNKEEVNVMEEPQIEKVILSVGANGEELDKGVKLLSRISGKKPIKTKSNKRIPTLGVSPGMEIGCMVTIRGEKAIEILKNLLDAEENAIRERKISKNTFSFGIEEYIEIPGIEYQRDIGVLGLNVTVTFKKPGRRVSVRKIKRAKIPEKQNVRKEEIIDYLENKLDVEIIR